MKKIRITLCALIISSIFLISSCGQIQSDKKHLTNVNTTTSPETNENASSELNNTSEQQKQRSETISIADGYSDSERNIRVLGLKEYRKIITDKFKDKASKGKKYLVLFLEVENKSTTDGYFNVNYLSAKADGKSIKNTFLLNDPKGYPTIFKSYNANSTFAGYIVWEVPSNWKKFDVTYNGWKDSDGLSLHLNLKPSNLKNLEKYDSVLYGN